MTTFLRRLERSGGRRSRWRARLSGMPRPSLPKPRTDPVRTMFKQAVGIALVVSAAAPEARAQVGGWAPPRCDLKPGHYLVNSGVLYLKSASTTRFEDQKQKDLRDAQRTLLQALGSGQDNNPAAWYYLARYFVVVRDFVGADSAFTKAETLLASCQQDVETWRRFLWVPLFNAGIAAWQAGNADSAMASFRRANTIFRGEPLGPKYLATLLANADQADSAVKYFRLAIDVAG